MSRAIMFLYGVVCYVVFFVTFLYLFGFMGNMFSQVESLALLKAIDDGKEVSLGESIVVNVLLLMLFFVQHSTMARPWFKEKWTQIIPKPIERSTYVLITSILFMLMFWQWRPMPTPIWQTDVVAIRSILAGLFIAGMFIVLYSSFLIDHFDLFGLRQVFLHLRGKEHVDKTFRTPALYRLVRHPLMLGFLISMWASPVMSYGHMIFTAGFTLYVLVAIRLEEHDLVEILGDDYRKYQQSTPMLLPIPKSK